ncbi:MAG: DUF1365 domain-containing protein [Thermoleophilaceae bacterium]|nr:DUF1365 domain-containing protein [Thermoleophilaceae bacterium]
MSTRSSVFVGTVSHTRLAPRKRAFEYPVYMLLLDLEELETPRRAARLFGGTRLFGAERAAPASFHRDDFLGDPARPLSECVRDLVEGETGERPLGAIRLLANPRTFGYQFNPIAIYYVYEGERLAHVVADVTNIPWRDSEAYVFAADSSGEVDGTADKRMHVSPFLEMDYEYRLRASAPTDTLTLSVTNSRDGAIEFAAGLRLQRRGAEAADLRRTLLRFPAMAIQVTIRIFWQALKMRAAGFRWYPRAERPEAVELEVVAVPASEEEPRVPVN